MSTFRWLSLFIIFLLACSSEPEPTGYKHGGGGTTPDDIVVTCNEDDFYDQWWEFRTSNAVANTLVPSYREWCIMPQEDRVIMWNTDWGYGFYDYDYNWYCENENTMVIKDFYSNNVYRVNILGRIIPECHEVKINAVGVSVKGQICSCPDPTINHDEDE